MHMPVGKSVNIRAILKSIPSLEKLTIKIEINKQLTAILIIISTSYVLLYLPLLITYILCAFDFNGFEISFNSRTMEQITDTLHTAGFAINCYLYIIGSKHRWISMRLKILRSYCNRFHSHWRQTFLFKLIYLSLRSNTTMTTLPTLYIMGKLESHERSEYFL